MRTSRIIMKDTECTRTMGGTAPSRRRAAKWRRELFLDSLALSPMRRVRSAHGARAARPATATGSAKRRREPKAPPHRASKFGTELSLLLSERSTKLGGRTVRELNQAAIRASQEPRERPASEGARIWMDWDKVRRLHAWTPPDASHDTRTHLAHSDDTDRH